MKLKIFLPLFISLCVTFTAAAQEDCPSIVKAALDTVDSACTQTSRNEVCYGNITLNATAQAGVSDLVFNKTGDRASVADIQTLKLSSMSLTDNSWGVALMKLQANLPDTLPGQNVTFLLFGDVQIENAVTDTSPVALVTSSAVNVRSRPSTSGSVMTSLKANALVYATGRLADSQWVRVKVTGDARGVGWVSADFLRGDVSKLAVITPGEPDWGPMQSFYFTSGVGDRPCDQAPDSGILIQTPKGAGKVTLDANDVQIQLGSTVYLQAQPSSPMTVTVVEGQATLQADGQTQIVPAGSYSQVQLNAAGKASGTPSFPKPYNADSLQTLPLGVDYFFPVTIAKPLTTAQITADIQAALAPVSTPVPVADGGSSTQNSVAALSGVWYETHSVTANTCDSNPAPGNAIGDVSHNTINFNFSDSRDSVVWDAPGWITETLSRAGDNVYQSVVHHDSNIWTLTVTFTSPTAFSFIWIDEPSGGPGCTYDMAGSGTFQG